MCSHRVAFNFATLSFGKSLKNGLTVGLTQCYKIREWLTLAVYDSPQNLHFMKKKRIFTCTPKPFCGDDVFFARDTGLICRTLQSLGVESNAILLLPRQQNDYADVLRTTLENLESVEWWKELNLDGVVLYSWGMRQYNRIARAIHKAGIRLVVHMDTSGNFDKLLPEDYTPLKAVKKWITSSLNNILRSRHLSYADVITMAPPVAERVSRMTFMDKSIVEKNYPMPGPVSPMCRYNGEEKKDIILCIGRWADNNQKRQFMLMETLAIYYATGGTAETRIYGKITNELREWHASLPLMTADRVKLLGFVENRKLWSEYAMSKVILCCSRYEGSHCVSSEALCCGCSVVVCNRPEPLRVVHWYTSKNSGTISQEDTADSLAQALHHELELWEKGERNPHAIAEVWQPHFHADLVLKGIFQL